MLSAEVKCDFLTAAVTPTFGRMKLVDLTVPWVYDCYDLLFAVQDDTVNIDAVVKPFQWPVWLGMLISMMGVITILNMLQYRLLPKIDSAQKSDRNSIKKKPKSHPSSVKKKKGDGKQFLYVFGMLLSQGGSCTSKRLPFRLVAGVWTLAAFIFVQAYTSTLFTYVVAPVNYPLVDSMYGVAESTDVNLLFRYGATLNIFVMDPNATGVFLKLRNNIDSFPNSRCNLISQCLSLITPGSRNTFADSRNFQMDAIKRNFEKTGKCGLQMAGDCFLSLPVNFALQKHSPYTETINKGLLDLLQTGMIDHWDSWFRPMPRQCKANVKKGDKKRETKHMPISLKNLTGAFLVLSVGLSISFLAFLVEQIISMIVKRNVGNVAELAEISQLDLGRRGEPYRLLGGQ
ncbi:ionotropic receptor 93a-like [Daphnia pulex]|uniref:ionotropic receptor 93a-like n=1 Tax=Daphnia pulex TaxID=6669 RepID=UPI001EDF5911|nr:ionotropic receptor 93a-like [Daphnia pulex]